MSRCRPSPPIAPVIARAAALLPVAALAAACAAVGAGTGSGERLAPERASAVPIPVGATYAWAAVPYAPDSGQPRLRPGVVTVHAAIVRAVDSVLVASGYRFITDPTNAQFLVDYHVGLHQQPRPATPPAATPARSTPARPAPTTHAHCASRDCWDQWGWWGAYGPPESTVRPYDYAEGTLMVDLDQRSSGELAWRGLGREPLDLQGPQSGGVRAFVDDAMRTLPRAE